MLAVLWLTEPGEHEESSHLQLLPLTARPALPAQPSRDLRLANQAAARAGQSEQISADSRPVIRTQTKGRDHLSHLGKSLD